MLVYIARRIVYVIPIVLSVALVCFLLVHITPGDPLVAVLPADASQELAAQMRTAYGFDRPLPVQFGLWLWRALHGDLGNSIATGRPVLADFSIFVVDLQDGGGWDWTQGEPPKTNPAYYLRFCKSFSRMGGDMRYVQCDNLAFMHNLFQELGGTAAS